MVKELQRRRRRHRLELFLLVSGFLFIYIILQRGGYLFLLLGICLLLMRWPALELALLVYRKAGIRLSHPITLRPRIDPWAFLSYVFVMGNFFYHASQRSTLTLDYLMNLMVVTLVYFSHHLSYVYEPQVAAIIARKYSHERPPQNPSADVIGDFCNAYDWPLKQQGSAQVV